MKTVQLSFETVGDPGGQPLIILHGFFASSRNWRQIARSMAERFHVFVLDLRNHGASPHVAVMDYPSMAADVEDFIRQLPRQDVYLMGHSMGGKVAMWLALNHPEMVQRLVVVDIAPVSYDHDFEEVLSALQKLPLEQIKNRRDALELLSGDIPDLSFRQFLLQNLQAVDDRYCWRIDLDIFADNASLIPGFPAAEKNLCFDSPVLFIGGENSRHIRPEYMKTIRRLFPKAMTETIPGAGHWLHAENPKRFIEVVSGFLE